MVIQFPNVILRRFIYFWQRWVSSHCCGFSHFGARAVGAGASAVVTREPSSRGAQAYVLHGMWDVPEQGSKPTFPVLVNF